MPLALRAFLFSSIPVLCAGLTAGCKARTPVIAEPFADDFQRVDLGVGWLDTSPTGRGRIADGRLNMSQGFNHPIWLRQRLPRDVVVEVDAMSRSPDGDLKLELFGDGESFDPDGNQYEATSYVFIFGGWGNQLSIIGRLGEHDEAVMVKRAGPPVVPGRTYHFTITRKGGQIDWQIDGAPFLSWTDPQPLEGERHGFLGFTNWKADVHFDNLKIRPAP